MKKPLLITLGIALIILILGSWLYLFIFGTPDSIDDVFSDFGYNPSEQPIIPVLPLPTTEPEEPTVDVAGEPLRQLTTRSVAGFGATTTATGLAVRYVEVGTGHVYEINLITGEERRISGTTVPRVTSAIVSEQADVVALTSESGNIRDTFIGSIITNDDGVGILDGINLPPGAKDITFRDKRVNYTLTTEEGTTGFTYLLETDEQTQLFAVPLRAIHTIWSNDGIFVYNHVTSQLEGALYSVNETIMRAVTPAAYGFTALLSDNYFITTKLSGENYVAQATDRSTTETSDLPISVIPEKCAFDSNLSTILWCGSILTALGRDAVEDWYKGTRSQEDFIWKIDIESETATLVLDPTDTASRAIDITNLQSSSPYLLFINKIDGTLWLYDSTST